MIHLIASDIDGTLLQGGQTRLDPALFDVIERLEQHGIRFAAASGRQYTNLRRLFAPVADKIDYICENGSLVISDGSVLYKQVIDRALGTKILRCMLEMEGCEPLLSGVMQCYVQPKDPAYADHMRYFVGNDVAVVEDLTAVPEPFLKIAAPPKNTVCVSRRLREGRCGLWFPVWRGWTCCRRTAIKAQRLRFCSAIFISIEKKRWLSGITKMMWSCFGRRDCPMR